MQTEKPIGNLLDSLGVTVTMDDTDLVVGAIVILKLVSDEGESWSRVEWSEGLDGFHRIGLLDATLTTERRELVRRNDAEDDDD